jgi:hypothetical protein
MKLGLTCGVFLAFWHLCWAFLVAIGHAQKLLDHLLVLHFINPGWQVLHFETDLAIQLAGVSFGAGLLMGITFALIWNHIQTRMP